MAEPSAPQPQSIVVEARIVRRDGSVEELGSVAEYHRNPLKRLAARLRGKGRVNFDGGDLAALIGREPA